MFYFSAYLKYENVNVIVVCWGALAAGPKYMIAANNTIKVGEYLGEFLLFLNRESNFEVATVHISGHSLGSHVAGLILKNIFFVNNKIMFV